MQNVNLNLNNNNANQITNLTIRSILTVGVSNGDKFYVSIDQAIVVYNCTASGCSSCTCSVTPPSAGTLHYSIVVTGFTSNVAELIVLVELKNPINSGYQVNLATTNALNYTK